MQVLEIREQLGPFNYDDVEYESTLGRREMRQLMFLENGVQYEGEWLKGTQIRQG